jgi:hypothetical protein
MSKNKSISKGLKRLISAKTDRIVMLKAKMSIKVVISN